MGIRLAGLDPSLVQWIQSQAGMGYVGDVRFMSEITSSSNQHRAWLQQMKVPDSDIFLTMEAAENVLTDYRNDAVVVMPGWYEETATTTWDKFDTHIIGTSPTINQPRIDIVQTTNQFTPMNTISGRGGLFKNLTFRHGVGSSDEVGTLISGRYNQFDNVYWMSPMVAGQDVSGLIGVNITGHGNHFLNCHFGSDGTARDQANVNVKISTRGNIFENCVFTMLADGTSPSFVEIDTADDTRYNAFKNCLFYAHYVNKTDQIVNAFKITGANSTASVIIDSRCQFVGVDYVSDATDDQHIWIATPGDTAATAASLLSVRNLGTG